jgi:hypothetical protein
MLAGMNTRPAPIPLRPDIYAREREQHRSLVRACTAMALGLVQRQPAPDVLRAAWPNDHGAELVLRAAVTPTTTSSAAVLGIDAVAFLVSLAPQSAAARLFERALRIDLTGIDVTNIARLAVAVPGFVAEGQAIPVVAGTAATTPVGPAFKMALIVALTNELEFASANNAAAIISRALADAASKQLDSVVFDNVSAAGRPNGLLNGLTPITATVGGGPSETSMVTDIANLAGALSDAGVDAENMVIVTNPGRESEATRRPRVCEPRPRHLGRRGGNGHRYRAEWCRQRVRRPAENRSLDGHRPAHGHRAGTNRHRRHAECRRRTDAVTFPDRFAGVEGEKQSQLVDRASRFCGPYRRSNVVTR